jgi:NAD(P)-dependent dehydrogenase (short-subunit alcohol dehydrogenase family)
LKGKSRSLPGAIAAFGLATAKRFVNKDAYVFITGRRDLAAAVKEIGSNVTGVQGDVSNLGDLDRLFAPDRAGEATARHRVRERRCRGVRPLR